MRGCRHPHSGADLALLPLKHLRVPAVDVEAKDGSNKNILHLLFIRTQARWNRLHALRASTSGVDIFGGGGNGNRQRLDPPAELLELWTLS